MKQKAGDGNVSAPPAFLPRNRPRRSGCSPAEPYPPGRYEESYIRGLRKQDPKGMFAWQSFPPVLAFVVTARSG